MSRVDHPSHYNEHPSGVECIDIVEHMSFNLGNAVKYIWRAGLKGAEREDLEKARWYLNRELERLESFAATDSLQEAAESGKSAAAKLLEMCKEGRV